MKMTIRGRARAIALFSAAVLCIAPLPAWAARKVTLHNMKSGCHGTLKISGSGWGNSKNNTITISAQNSSTLPVEGVIAHTKTNYKTGKFSTSLSYRVISPCDNACLPESTVKITAKGSHGNTASRNTNLPGLYCGIIWGS